MTDRHYAVIIRTADGALGKAIRYCPDCLFHAAMDIAASHDEESTPEDLENRPDCALIVRYGLNGASIGMN